MTPDIKPTVQHVDQEFPRLRIDNTYKTIGELSFRVVDLAGPDWAPIGKTAGESQWLPDGFTPYSITLLDQAGVSRTVTISGWSHDAVWHVPSRTQIKLISNSAANSDPDPAVWGIGNIACYQIDPANYRWYNPPVDAAHRPAAPAPATPPMPVAPPVHPPAGILPKGEALTLLRKLDAFYRAQAGLQREFSSADATLHVGGMMIWDGANVLVVDHEAVAQWFYQGVVEGKTFEQIVLQIQQSAEWQSKHPHG